jgi:hypothetical protein
LCGVGGGSSTDTETDLFRSQGELRAALRVADKGIRKLNSGHSDTPVLKLLRRVLRDSRAVATAENSGKVEALRDAEEVRDGLQPSRR